MNFLDNIGYLGTWIPMVRNFKKLTRNYSSNFINIRQAMVKFQIGGEGLTTFIESISTDDKVDLKKLRFDFEDTRNCYSKIKDMKEKIKNPTELFDKYSKQKLGEITFSEF